MIKQGYTLAELAQHIGAQLRGDPACRITGVASLQQAGAEQVSFLDNPRYRKYLAKTQAAAIILAPAELAACSIPALVTETPYLGYAKVATLFQQLPKATVGIHPSAVVAENCQIHPTASIGPLCVLGSDVVIGEGVIIGAGCVIGEGVQIGAHSRLWANVTLYYGTTIGQRAVIHSGAVIGSDGFGIANDKGRWYKVPQLGKVCIGDDVEIGANTTIDRGAVNDTVIEEGAKLDNQVQIGHNVRIGAHTAIAGCTGIAGSTQIGKHCLIGGGVGIAGHLEITDQVALTAMSGVSTSIDKPGVYSSGFPALPNHDWWKNLARFRKLDEMARQLRKLEAQLQQLQTPPLDPP